MRVGGYSLDLYCDRLAIKKGDIADQWGHRYDEFPHQFYGETGPGCDRQARARGWLISQHRALCPKCNPRRALSSLPKEKTHEG